MSDDWHKTLPPEEVRKRGGTVYFTKVKGGVTRFSSNYKANMKINVPVEGGLIRRLTIEEAENDPEP